MQATDREVFEWLVGAVFVALVFGIVAFVCWHGGPHRKARNDRRRPARKLNATSAYLASSAAGIDYPMYLMDGGHCDFGGGDCGGDFGGADCGGGDCGGGDAGGGDCGGGAF